jgi:putative two-component system response regulator
MMSEDRFLPVIVLTADATPHTKKRALEARAIDYLTKPLDAAEVLLRVRNHLRTRLLHVHMEAEVRRGIRELEQAQIEVLERLAQAAEFRDDDTGQHTYRVGEMASRLARALGFADTQAELLRRAAPLHDVGKIGIPDAVLLKPGRLTAEEMALMRNHATIGANLLSGGRSELMQMAEQIALTHHERWDGTGYPAGLRGDAIPLTGRIVAVTDVFDALSSDRPYRPAWPIEQVREEITRGVGTHFDPQVATAFLQLEGS